MAGCEDDDESAGGTAGESAPRISKAEFTKAEFIKQADELCADFRQKRDELTAKADATSDAERQADIFRELADEAQATGEEFDQLPVPPRDEEIIERFSAANRNQIGVVRQVADALDAGDTEAVRALLASGQKSGAKVRGIAQRYGFQVCGSESE